MNRKEFLRRSGHLCCASALLSITDETANAQDKPAEPVPPTTPLDKRVEQGQKVIRRLINQLDQNLDKATREKLMEDCGTACFTGAYGAAGGAPTPEQVDKFMEAMKKRFGPDAVQQVDGQTVVYFRYISNPRGLKVADGFCLCPILEDAPKNISPTYCHCSVGYVRQIFERQTGKRAIVELTDSVLRGGKSCNFTVRLQA